MLCLLYVYCDPNTFPSPQCLLNSEPDMKVAVSLHPRHASFAVSKMDEAFRCFTSLTLYHTIPTFNSPIIRSLLKKTLWENTDYRHFLLFTQYFLPFPKQISIFQSHLFCCLQMLSIWTCLKFCRLIKS